MTPQRYPVMVLIMATVFGVTGLCASLAGAQPAPGKKPLRPAATASTPEEQSLKQLPTPPAPEEVEAQAKIPLEQHCLSNPKCRAKLEQAKQGKRPAVILPAATEPTPEEKWQKSLPPPPVGPQGSIPGRFEGLFSWLNPFAPSPAWGQTSYFSTSSTSTSTNLSATTTTVWPLTYSPTKRSSTSPVGSITFNGGNLLGTASYYTMSNTTAVPSPYTENKPYALVTVYLPSAGSYLLDISATPSILKLRHQAGGPIIETWDLAKGCGASICHYQTVDAYAAGYQYWYIWADPKVWGTYFYSITIKPAT